MPFLSSFKSEKEELSLLIDIGNGSIGGALVLFGKTIPKIIYNTRLPFAVVNDLDSSRLSQGMETLLDQTLATIMKKGFAVAFGKNKPKKLSMVFVSFSSPWFESLTKDIHISEKKPFIISEKFLNSILSREEKIFHDELSKSNEDAKNDNFVMIEKSIVHTKINGYIIDEIMGKKTPVFDLTLRLAVLPKNIIDKVNSAVLKHTHITGQKVRMNTFPLVSFTVLRDLFPNVSNFIIIDITSEITELTQVKEAIITGTISFPSGKNFIIRQIAKVFNVPTEVAESILHLYNINKTDSSTLRTMQEVLINVEKEWSIYFEDALAGLSPQMNLPSKVFLTADSNVAQIFIDFIKLSKADSTLNFRKIVDVVHVNGNLLSHLLQNNPANNPDEFIGLLTLFYKKMR